MINVVAYQGLSFGYFLFYLMSGIQHTSIKPFLTIMAHFVNKERSLRMSLHGQIA